MEHLDKRASGRYEFTVSMQQQIEEKLRAEFAPSELRVRNESYKHGVPKGSETHFNVVVVSGCFENKSAVARHQLVYAALAEELKSGVHALAITARTPEEWARAQTVEPSPPCVGGSKADSG